MTLIAVVVALVLFAALVVFQLALAAGAPWGRAAYGGQNPGVLPGRLRVSSVVAAASFTPCDPVAIPGLATYARKWREVAEGMAFRPTPATAETTRDRT